MIHSFFIQECCFRAQAECSFFSADFIFVLFLFLKWKEFVMYFLPFVHFFSVVYHFFYFFFLIMHSVRRTVISIGHLAIVVQISWFCWIVLPLRGSDDSKQKFIFFSKSQPRVYS